MSALIRRAASQTALHVSKSAFERARTKSKLAGLLNIVACRSAPLIRVPLAREYGSAADSCEARIFQGQGPMSISLPKHPLVTITRGTPSCRDCPAQAWFRIYPSDAGGRPSRRVLELGLALVSPQGETLWTAETCAASGSR